MTQEALNIAGQCRATASSPLAKNISVDEGNGLLTELLLDAARVIEALAQEQEPVALQKSGIANSPSDPEICNERSAQACGPVYCGDSGGYCNKCPKQKIIQAVKPCKGMNCGCTDGRSHSLECLAELAAAIAGGVFVQKALSEHAMQEVQRLGQEIEQEPVAYATKEDFHRELERRLKHIREEMKIKSVTMRCKDYDIALPIIDTDFGRVLVGQVSTPPQRKPLTDDELSDIWYKQSTDWMEFARAIEAKLKETT